MLRDEGFRGRTLPEPPSSSSWGDVPRQMVGEMGGAPGPNVPPSARKLDSYLGILKNDPLMYYLTTPMLTKVGEGRHTRDLPVRPPHEMLDREFSTSMADWFLPWQRRRTRCIGFETSAEPKRQPNRNDQKSRNISRAESSSDPKRQPTRNVSSSRNDNRSDKMGVLEMRRAGAHIDDQPAHVASR